MQRSANQTDYTRRPIIVEGVGHSGTRVVVQILSALGSDGGDCNNLFKENKFFLNIHESLIAKVSNRGWAETILNLMFIKEFHDDLRYRDFICSLLESELLNHYPNATTSPWHWKCPASALFEKTWVEIFPEAYYIHVVRNPVDCAESYLKRGQLHSMKEGIEYYRIMHERITEVQKKNYLQIEYGNLADEIEKIRNFVPFVIDSNKVEMARSLIKKEDKYWYRGKTIRRNLLNVRGKLLSSLFKLTTRSRMGPGGDFGW